MPKPPIIRSYIGVDPGMSGGVAVIIPRFNALPELYPMWGTETDMLKGLRLIQLDVDHPKAYIELIQTSIHAIGKSQMSKLYGNYSQLRMALLAAEIPFETVRPVEWQRGLKIPPKKKGETRAKWKNRLKAKAQELFPSAKGLTLKTCDALLIAEYCRRNSI